MMYYALVILTTFLLSLGLILLKNPFFSFAIAAAALLNALLESAMNEVAKQKLLIKNLKKLLARFGIFLILTLLTISISLIPIMLYMQFEAKAIKNLDTTSFPFYISMLFGSAFLFIFFFRKKKKDYSEWSVLLHKMVLDNYNISGSLFRLEKKLFKKKANIQSESFVIVTGLARSGTTALTNLLFRSGKFHSLSYANMPFLLACNIWKKVYNPGKNKLKQRAHGDKVMFGYKTIEALEEYFFKVFLKDKYITNSALIEHKIDEHIYKAYLTYQNLVKIDGIDSTYLAKNNNFILRYESLRKYNPHFKIILIFRNPTDHALSLMNQHMRFSSLQENDPFVLDYMNWLGHHEFGLNHKVFDLDQMGLCNQYATNSINYWLALWVSYYTRVLSLPEDENLILVDYTDLLDAPDKLISALGKGLKLDLIIDKTEPFDKSKTPKTEIDPELKTKSTILFNKLTDHKIEIYS